jgi:hypothetical protein
MKKTRFNFLLALFLGFASHPVSAARMSLENGGTGQVLIYPFYTTNDGFDTYISTTNNTDEIKAIRVRILDSLNGVTVLGFNVFIPARATWTNTISANKLTGGAAASLGTVGCTTPSGAPSQKVDLRTYAFLEKNADAQPVLNTDARTRQGFVEVLEMGVVSDPRLIIASVGAGEPAKLAACEAFGKIYDLSQPNGVAIAFENALTSPTGGLSGGATLINVADGVSYGYRADALSNVFSSPQHSFPTHLASDRRQKPSLKDANKEIAMMIGGATISAEFATGPEAVSALYQSVIVSSEWTAEPSIGASSAFVLTLPTKSFFTTGVADTKASPPFRIDPRYRFASEPVSIGNFYRDGVSSKGGGGLYVTGVGPPSVTLTGHAMVANIPNRQNGVTYGSLAAPGESGRIFWDPGVGAIPYIPIGGDNRTASSFAGSLSIGFLSTPLKGHIDSLPSPASLDDVRIITAINGSHDGVACKTLKFHGLPVTGFAVQKYVNGNVGGVLSNYGVLLPFKIDRKIECLK